MDLNEIFGKEFNKIRQEEIAIRKSIADIQECINQIPPITDLVICKRLENEYQNLYEYTMLLANTYMKLSQLYHYTELINRQSLDAQNTIK